MASESPAAPTPSADELAALLDCFRYGDVEQDDLGDIQRFTEHYGERWLAEARDDRGNTPLHMAGGNGHLDIVRWLLPKLPAEALVAQNSAQSTPLHWVAINYHLSILELLCPLLPRSAFDLQNHHGKTAVEEAEEACEALVVAEEDQETPKGQERVRREKCVAYILGCMGLGVKAPTGGDESKAEETDGDVVSASATAAKETGATEADVQRLTERAQKIKLEQEEKKRLQEEAARA